MANLIAKKHTNNLWYVLTEDDTVDIRYLHKTDLMLHKTTNPPGITGFALKNCTTEWPGYWETKEAAKQSIADYYCLP